jgi:sec-independent protein translocase protein TatC
MENVFLNMVDPHFITFELLCKYLGVCVDQIHVDFQSTTLAGQFSYALMMSIMGGVVLAFPYIFYQLWSFIKPGLKGNEKDMAKGIVFYVSLLFFLGILFGYYIVAPLSVQFFGAFQITPEIKTDVTIASYMSTILSTVFYTGLFFLFPIVTFLLVKIGLFTPDFLIKYRKHAIVVILILAAVITPPDVISQVIVTIPIYLLFEVSILVAKRVVKQEKN